MMRNNRMAEDIYAFLLKNSISIRYGRGWDRPVVLFICGVACVLCAAVWLLLYPFGKGEA